MAKRKKKRNNPGARSGEKATPKQNQAGVLFAGTGMASLMDQGATGWRDATAPSWFVWTVFLWFPLVALLAVYGHQHGYSPDLHMSSLIQAGGLGLLAMLFLLQRDTGLDIYVPRILLPAVLFVAWMILSLWWAINEYEGLVKVLDWGGAVLAGLLVAHVLRSREDVYLLLNVVLAVAVLLLFIGYMQYFFKVRWIDQFAPPSMTFNNKNMAAQYTLLFLPIAIGMGLCARAWWIFLLYIGISIASAAFIVVGLTRGAILAMGGQFAVLMGLLLLYGFYHRVGGFRRVLLVLTVLLALAVLILMMMAPEAIVGVYEKATTTVKNILNFEGETRFAIWANTVAMISDHLFAGVGSGNWMVYYPKYHLLWMSDWEVGVHRQHINVHQDYLEITAELGLVGLALLLAFILAIAFVALSLIKNMRSADVFIVIGLTTAIAGLFINSMGSFGLQQPLPVCMMMIYAAVLDYYWRTEHNLEPRWKLQPKMFYGAPMVLAALGFVVIFSLHAAWYKSEVHYRQALLASGKDAVALLHHGEQALKYAPGRTRAMNFVARGYTEKGDRERAINSYKRILSDYPYMLHTLDNAAIAMKYFGLREEARDLYLRYVEYRNTATDHGRVGIQFVSMGYVEDGLKHMRRSINNHENDLMLNVDRQRVKSVLKRHEDFVAQQQRERQRQAEEARKAAEQKDSSDDK